jgi:hypothetical protein
MQELLLGASSLLGNLTEIKTIMNMDGTTPTGFSPKITDHGQGSSLPCLDNPPSQSNLMLLGSKSDTSPLSWDWGLHGYPGALIISSILSSFILFRSPAVTRLSVCAGASDFGNWKGKYILSQSRSVQPVSGPRTRMNFRPMSCSLNNQTVWSRSR